MNESKRMTSIARKINWGFWLREFGDFLFINLIIILLCAVVLFFICEDKLPQEIYVSDRHFEFYEGINEYENLIYVITGSDENEYVYFIHDYLDYLITPALVLIGAEIFILFIRIFYTGRIRRKMKPLNDLAIKVEELSSASYDPEKLENLEHAISNVRPDVPGARVSTGDHELQSIEVALNNLLDRMRESQRQQNRFVSDASHELRTPIAVIQGYVNMLDRWGKEDENILNESIEALKNESEHMKNLVEQLLFLARGDSGRNTLKFETVNLTDIVREVCEESMMIDENHVYQFKGDEDVAMYGDLAMLKQSVRIFTDNASKYSNKGDTITLGVKSENGKAVYYVQDEGVGMQSSEVVHVFERFYRSDSARNSRTGGSGLGLSIAKWIIDAHNGEIEILSRPEFGTRFTVSFNKL